MSRNKSLIGIVAALTAMTFAFAVVATAGASGATFKYSNAGELTGESTSEQVFTFGGLKVTCKKAHLTGTVTETESAAQKVRIEYSECSALGSASATVSPAEYNIHANGEVDVLNEIKITVPLGFCSVTVAKQNGLKSVSFVNKAGGKIELKFNLGGMRFKGSGGSCGGEGTTGTYTGSFLIELTGGTIGWEA